MLTQRSNTGLDSFDHTIRETNELLNSLENKLGWKNRRQQSYDLLRSSLQALRDRLPVHQAVHLGSELPMLVRGFYYEGWDPNSVPLKYNRSQFLDHAQKKFPPVTVTAEEFEELVSKTLTTVLDSVPQEIRQQIKEMLPEEIASLLG